MSAMALSFLPRAVPPILGVVLDARTMLEYGIYAGALVLVSVIVTLWIATSRLPLQDDEPRHHHRSPFRWLTRWFGGRKKSDASGRKGRRRRAHRHRNPTLAETGGLPPVRNQSASSAPEHHQD